MPPGGTARDSSCCSCARLQQARSHGWRSCPAPRRCLASASGRAAPIPLLKLQAWQGSGRALRICCPHLGRVGTEGVEGEAGQCQLEQMHRSEVSSRTRARRAGGGRPPAQLEAMNAGVQWRTGWEDGRCVVEAGGGRSRRAKTNERKAGRRSAGTPCPAPRPSDLGCLGHRAYSGGGGEPGRGASRTGDNVGYPLAAPSATPPQIPLPQAHARPCPDCRASRPIARAQFGKSPVTAVSGRRRGTHAPLLAPLLAPRLAHAPWGSWHVAAPQIWPERVGGGAGRSACREAFTGPPRARRRGAVDRRRTP